MATVTYLIVAGGGGARAADGDGDGWRGAHVGSPYGLRVGSTSTCGPIWSPGPHVMTNISSSRLPMTTHGCGAGSAGPWGTGCGRCAQAHRGQHAVAGSGIAAEQFAGGAHPPDLPHVSGDLGERIPFAPGEALVTPSLGFLAERHGSSLVLRVGIALTPRCATSPLTGSAGLAGQAPPADPCFDCIPVTH